MGKKKETKKNGEITPAKKIPDYGIDGDDDDDVTQRTVAASFV